MSPALVEDTIVIPYDRLTFFRNRSRVRDLRLFRQLLEAYFEAEDGADDHQVDWGAARATRSRINQMLPRVMEIVAAAGLDASADPTGRRPLVADVTILRNIFGARYADGTAQPILDLIDMATGVYESTQYVTLIRTVNPVHYAARTLSWVLGLPRRALAGLGLWPERGRAPHLGPHELTRLEALATRLADAEGAIQRRLEEMHDRQAQRLSAYAGQLEDLHERLDFAERMLAQRDSLRQIKPPARPGAGQGG